MSIKNNKIKSGTSGSDHDKKGDEALVDIGLMEAKFGFLLRAAWKDASRTFQKHFQEYEITPAEYGFLVLIGSNPGSILRDLVSPMGINQNNLVKMLNEMIKRGLVRKKKGKNDQRVRQLFLTKKGQDFLADLNKKHTEYDAEFDQRVGREKLDQLCEILLRFNIKT